MKFSAAVLVSLSLPLAAQSAQAEDQGTADFLKSSLSPAAAAPARAQKSRIVLSALRPQAAEVKPAYGVKLRPFVPNRKLPSKHDLELELLAQTPRMAAPPQTSLSGQVSEFGAQSMTEMPRAYNQSISTYDSATLNRYSAPRVTPNQVIATPGQVRVNRQVRKQVARPMSFQPQVASSNSQSSDWLGQPRAGERMIRQGGALLAQAPAAVPSEERLADLGYPSAEEIATPPAPVPSSSGNDIIRPPQMQQQMESQEGPGPAPFPLSLLPQDQLKSLIRSRVKNKVQAPPAYFGSWHGPQQASSLPPGGFQTHMHSHGFAAPAPANNYAHIAPRIAKHSAPGRANMMQAVAQKPHQEMRIAVYPPYSHQPPMAP